MKNAGLLNELVSGLKRRRSAWRAQLRTFPAPEGHRSRLAATKRETHILWPKKNVSNHYNGKYIYIYIYIIVIIIYICILYIYMIHLIRYKMSHKKLFYFHWKNRSIFLMKHKSQESMKNMIWTWRMFHKSQEHGQSIWAHSERIRLRELLQESRTFNGKIYGFPLRFSLKPMHWHSGESIAPWSAIPLPRSLLRGWETRLSGNSTCFQRRNCSFRSIGCHYTFPAPKELPATIWRLSFKAAKKWIKKTG